ncbi:Uu.00g082070.m01.CDS01 [Anthostomella pinea]|uniref:Uu.00g082070.m01.CDS01 n=1 Tax=Anthostomella pinea TaxID=933095 RepID=A0AAI8YJD0_9PEZI|nr:Uu.00g082070.m01.CDS01 [Anthostomella pinea]
MDVVTTEDCQASVKEINSTGDFTTTKEVKSTGDSTTEMELDDNDGSTTPKEPNHTNNTTALSNFNETDDPASLHQCFHKLFEQSAAKHAAKDALCYNDEALTYGELNALANRMARALVERGVRSGDMVGVALDRSVELVTVLIAVMKTGATYVPIDPAFPAERINQMMEDAAPKLLVTGGGGNREAFAAWESVCLGVDETLQMTDPSSSNGSEENLDIDIPSDGLAYVMYTSGSTGRPKGVEVSHGSVANLLLSMQREPGCNQNDRLLALTTVSFDMAVLELFLPLLCDATTVLAQSHEIKDPAAIVRLMRRHDVTIMQGTPAIWQMLLDSGWRGEPRLEKIFCGGEALPRPLADRLLACGDVVWNMYGPTEATVYAAIWRVRQGHAILVGGPITNGRLYVLDADLAPVPLGSPGELYIGGAGVARGYRNNAELSSSRFLKNPFHEGLMYRTGDNARLIAPGELSVMGRIDGQVKIRGHRIELGDIEAAITSHDAISGAVVVSRDDRLVAYCVVQEKARPLNNNNIEAKTAPLDRVLRPWLTKRLPGYMVPAFFVSMAAFPVTLNGKTDRNALPDPIASIQPITADMMKPATELEGQILAIWSGVLGHDRIGVDDSFFEVGGDSARLVRVQRELEGLLGLSVPSPTLFEYYTVKMLAAHLTSSPGVAGHELVTKQRRMSDAEDIAVVSMACRLPGGIDTPEGFWELLERGGDAITDVPEGRWGDDDAPDNVKSSYYSRGGFFPSIHSYDTSFFGISPREARALDPSQYMMLETCWEGFERAGYTMEQLRGSQTGVFIGTSNILAHQRFNRSDGNDLADLDGYTVTGSSAGTMSGRISYQLGLEGPAMTIDTACSSSLVATHLACSALRQGECDIAVSGGVSLMLNPGLHVEFSRLQGMSPDGRCRAFSADAQGTGWSEGSVVTILKRLSDAQRDGDTMHAVIRGTAVNHDGRSASLTTPSGAAQRRLIRTALTVARLQPDDIDYIEAHGTATKLGDPIEAAALADVFGPSRTNVEPLLIGSAKSNIGHLQAAAGLVGLLKVTLAMHYRTLPQTLHITKPTPAVDWQGAKMMPVLEKRPWLSHGNRLRRAGVSAFGIGGTNAHVIVEEPPREVATANRTEKGTRQPSTMPFLLSGDSEIALRRQAEKLHQHISTKTNRDDVSDVAYSLATTRSHFRKRLVLMAKDRAELLERLGSITHPGSFALPATDAAEAPRLAMLFTGQGSQWSGMGKDLSETYPVFREAIHEIAAEFTELDLPLLEVMWSEPGSTAAALLDRTDFAQPALFTLEVALWRLWQGLGVKPEYVLGHSLGELVAAHVAGIFDLPDACRLVAARGRLMQNQTGNTRMVSLEASAAEVEAAIDESGFSGKVDVAAYNTPMQTVISGDNKAVDKVTAHLARQGRKTKTLVVGHAFHSRHIDGMLGDLRAVAETIRYNSPHLSIVSSLDGRLVHTGQLEQADYWVKQAREPVRFGDGIRTLALHGVNVFLELGPQQVLCGLGAACLADEEDSKSAAWLPSCIPRQDGASTIQRSLADLHERRVPIDWSAYFRPFGCQRVNLPTYAFQRSFDRAGTQKLAAANGISDTLSRAPHGGQGRFQFEVAWHPVETDNVHPSGTWGLMLPVNDGTWAGQVEADLSRAGIKVVRVEHLKQAEGLDGLVCLWDSDADVISQTRDFTAKALIQLQTAAQTQFMPPLVWLTRGAVGTGTDYDDRAMRLGAGPLWGLMRTARTEHPELHLRQVDLGDVDEMGTSMVSAVIQSTEPECAVRQGRVLSPRMQRVKLVPRPVAKQPLVRSDGAVLITGAFGDLGTRVAIWLARKHDVRDLVLASRRGMEAPGADELVVELSELGVRVTVIASNIADPESVKSVMEIFSEARPLRGIVHAAGVSDSGVLSAMTPERFVTTLAPKVFGAWLLHHSTRDMDLDLFMMFSSISGVMGMAGLANYAAANASLDALAHLRRAEGLPATSVAYGTWVGGGMASRLVKNTLSQLSHFGLDTLPPEDGLELLEHAVVSNRPLTVAAALDLGRLQGYFEERGGIPPLLRSLLFQDSAQSLRGLDLYKVLSEASPGQHSDIVLNMVREVVAKALGFAKPLGVDVDRPLRDIGIDSLTAVQLRNHLATLTGLKLSVNIAFLYPNLKALSQYLLSQLRDSDTSSSSATASGSATPATTASDSPELDMTAIRKGCLDRSFTFDNVANDPTAHTIRPESVFLTGATGFVGASVLHELLKQGISTHCLVRADCVNTARQRLVATLEDYGLWEPSFASLVHPTVGDMAQPFLGLTEEAFENLAEQVDAICHSGGLVDWLRPLEEYVGPNIVSTHEVLRLASCGRAKAVHLVSTISTIPKHCGLDLTEEDQEYGYGTSKYIAERLVAAARWRGARASVYRLPYVTASTTTGYFRLDRGDFLHNFIVGCLELGAFPSIDADMSAVLPVDYLGKTMVVVMTQDLHQIGRDFDFRNSRAPTCTDFFRLVGNVSGGKEIMTFNTWKQRALDYATAYPTSPIARITAVLDSYTDKTAPSMFKGLPVGDNVFGGDNYPAPLVDERSMTAYLNRIGTRAAKANTKR